MQYNNFRPTKPNAMLFLAGEAFAPKDRGDFEAAIGERRGGSPRKWKSCSVLEGAVFSRHR